LNLMAGLSRRTFLAAGAGALVAAACGGSGSGNGSGDKGAKASGATALVARFQDGTFVPGAQRVAFSLGNKDGLVSDNVPARLDARVLDGDGKVVVNAVSADRHDKGLPLPYWPFTLALTAPGVYTLKTSDNLEGSFSVVDPSQEKIPKPGEKLPPFDTPTTTDSRGVNPICSRQPICPLHDITLTQALQTGKPVAYFIGTPAFCQTGVCGPILDFVVAQHQRLGDKVAMVHADVYTDSAATTTTPAVNAYNMTFEPCLWVADASGTVVERLDFVFDEGELSAAVAKVTA
jgi:hypothetical protein